MQETDVLDEPANEETLADNEEVVDKLGHTENQDELILPSPVKSSYYQHDDVCVDDSILSNTEDPIYSTIKIQESYSLKEEDNADKCLENGRAFDEESTVCLEQPAENVTFREAEKSPGHQGAQEQAFHHFPAAEPREIYENLESLQVCQNAELEQQPIKRKRGRPRTKHLLKPQVVSESDLSVHSQDSARQTNPGKRRKVSASGETIRKMPVERREQLPRNAQVNSTRYSTGEQIIGQPRSIKGARKGKLKREKRASWGLAERVKISERIAALRPMEKPAGKKRGRKRVLKGEEKNLGPSKTKSSSSIKKPRSKKKVDLSDPIFHEPFKFGWKREVVYRAYTKESRADVYYYSPGGEKLRSFVEIRKKRKN